MLLSIDEVKKIDFPCHVDGDGELVVMEGQTNLPFAIARVFVVRAPEGAFRGQHAHRLCSQLLTCPNGLVEVECTDGEHSSSFILDHPNVGLLVPPSIWSKQLYSEPGTALTVLCDRPYEAEDYIRDYQEFLEYRNDLKK